MKIRQAISKDEPTLLALMRQAHGQPIDSSDEEWIKTETAMKTLLRDPLAGEAQLILDETDQLIGYMIVCRGFSLDYGGYFTWVEETYFKEAQQSPFRDERFSPPSNEY